jgi:uncharacterized protein YjiS (DUF1127 family)
MPCNIPADTDLKEIAMMSKPYFDSETSLAKSHRDPGAIAQPWIARWLRVLLTSVARVDKAHSQRCELASLPQDVLRDTGLPPEDAASIAGHQPDLPFFMQSGFGQR